VSPGSPIGEYPPLKKTLKSTHARRRPGEGTPSDKHELCDRKFYLPASKASRRHSRLTLLSHPSPSDPRRTLL